jgi:dihydrodipicolinate synthase/N-acetylneuraminate lyase
MESFKSRAGVIEALRGGLVIPACPLALDAGRKLDPRRQRALLRYYAAAGAGGVAVGVHTTQFAIREPAHGLFRPVLELAAEELRKLEAPHQRTLVRIGGICGHTRQAIAEATLLRELGYDLGLLSLGALRSATIPELLTHCREVARIIPIMGFYLQPSVGGRMLPFSFWRQLAELENVAAIKIAPFNRYQTLEVVRAVAEAGRSDIALYTGNDDHIALDLLTPWRSAGTLGGMDSPRRRVA